MACRDRVVVYPEGLWIPRAGFESRSRPQIITILDMGKLAGYWIEPLVSSYRLH